MQTRMRNLPFAAEAAGNLLRSDAPPSHDPAQLARGSAGAGKRLLQTFLRQTHAMRMIAPDRMLRREVAR